MAGQCMVEGDEAGTGEAGEVEMDKQERCCLGVACRSLEEDEYCFAFLVFIVILFYFIFGKNLSQLTIFFLLNSGQLVTLLWKFRLYFFIFNLL